MATERWALWGSSEWLGPGEGCRCDGDGEGRFRGGEPADGELDAPDRSGDCRSLWRRLRTARSSGGSEKSHSIACLMQLPHLGWTSSHCSIRF